MKAFSKTEVLSLNYEYDKTNKKMLLVSVSKNKGGKEFIVGEKYDAYEKEGQILWKTNMDEDWDYNESNFFLDLKTMKLKVFSNRDGYEDQTTMELTYECKKVK